MPRVGGEPVIQLRLLLCRKGGSIQACCPMGGSVIYLFACFPAGHLESRQYRASLLTIDGHVFRLVQKHPSIDECFSSYGVRPCFRTNRAFRQLPVGKALERGEAGKLRGNCGAGLPWPRRFRAADRDLRVVDPATV